jgi:hypothetical protein
LKPTADLINRKAKLKKKDCKLNTILVEGAYDDLMNGRKDLHDMKIRNAILEYAAQSDVLVLAQASMASAINELNGISESKVLTSPLLGIEKLKKDLMINQ